MCREVNYLHKLMAKSFAPPCKGYHCDFVVRYPLPTQCEIFDMFVMQRELKTTHRLTTSCANRMEEKHHRHVAGYFQNVL